MSLLFVDGCNHTGRAYSPTRKYSEATGLDWHADDLGPPDPLSRIPGRNYNRCIANEIFDHTQYLPERDEIIVGFAWWMPGTFLGQGQPTIFENDDGVQCSFFLTSDGKIEAYRGTSGGTLLGASDPNVMPSGEWQYIEMRAKVHNSDGEMEARISGEVVVSVTGEDTQLQATSGITRWKFQNPDNTNDVGHGNYMFREDLYILDRLGEYCNDFLGDIRIDTIQVNLAGNYAEWVPSGEATNFECVDEAEIDLDTTYIKTKTLGEKASFQFHSLDDHLDQLGLPIKAISLVIPHRNEGWGDVRLKPFFRKDAADYVSGELRCVGYPTNVARYQTGQTPQEGPYFDYFMSNYIDGFVENFSSAYDDVRACGGSFIWHENVKDGGAWTESDFVSGEFGIELSKNG